MVVLQDRVNTQAGQIVDLNDTLLYLYPPTISPPTALPNETVTVSDVAGRRIQTDDNMFFLSTATSNPVPVAGLTPVVTPDNRMISATVPLIAAGDYHVAVRATAAGPDRFTPVLFVANPLPDASISPASGAVGTSFTITDAGGRIQPGDMAILYLPGDDPATGTPAVGVTIAGGSSLAGTIPNIPVGIDYMIAVRPSPTAPSRFNDLRFTVA